VRELSGVLSEVIYTAQFPALGMPGHYVGLAEYYWLQLPWAVTALFVAWLVLEKRRGERAFGVNAAQRRGQMSSAFMLITLHGFVMYARCDETHIFQFVVMCVPIVFVLLAELDALVSASSVQMGPRVRVAVAGLALLMAKGLFVVPHRSDFEIGRGDWKSPKLEHLRYRQWSRYVTEASPNLTDHDWDIAEDRAGAYVKSISRPNEDMLLLMANGLIHFDSETHPIGGRYYFYFYLASVGLLDRAGFDKVVPRELIQSILDRPPRVIVCGLGSNPLSEVVPEFEALKERWYVQTHHFRHILIYELRIDGQPVAMPLRDGYE
jgi:hypothetical protein